MVMGGLEEVNNGGVVIVGVVVVVVVVGADVVCGVVLGRAVVGRGL